MKIMVFCVNELHVEFYSVLLLTSYLELYDLFVFSTRPEQFILVVEDITPRNEEEDEEFHVDTIPDHILRTPERLSPLFIKLCYISRELFIK